MAKITKISDKGVDLIKKFEGFSSKPYPDPATNGIPYTIGYGATFYKNGKKVTMADKPITEKEAIELLKFMLARFEQYVDSYCVDTLTQNQFDALVSFCYNVGPANLKASTLLKKVNANPNDETIREEFRKWNKGGGKVLKGLTRRREAEANLYFQK
jgi:lysozyme